MKIVLINILAAEHRDVALLEILKSKSQASVICYIAVFKKTYDTLSASIQLILTMLSAGWRQQLQRHWLDF